MLHSSGEHISESKQCYNIIPSVHYIYVKTEILVEFQICISVPLTASDLTLHIIITDQDDVRKSRNALLHRCRGDRVRNANNRINTYIETWEKSEKEEVFNLVKDSIDGVIKKDGIIKKEVFNNLLDILVHDKSIKRNKIGNRECLYLPKRDFIVIH